jgi:hypothetical protein
MRPKSGQDPVHESATSMAYLGGREWLHQIVKKLASSVAESGTDERQLPAWAAVQLTTDEWRIV